MKRPQLSTDAEIKAFLSEYPEWQLRENSLHRELRFADFHKAWMFMSGVALIAEKMDHHPNWYNVYNQVRIELSTHDVGGVTILDIELATQVERLL